MTYSPTLAQVLDAALTRRQGELHTALPGRVESYDAEKQVADVQPLVQALALAEDGTRSAVSLPVLPAVPVVFPGGGGYRATYPLAKGDTVLLVFAEASLDAWQPRGGVVAPPDTRRHHLADCVAIAGLHDDAHAWTGAATDAATWGKDGGPQVVARSGGIELGGDAANPPTEVAVLGSTYLDDEGSMLDDLLQRLANMATALVAASASLATAATANAVPMVGGGMALAPLTVVVQQLGSVVAELTTAVTTITEFRAKDATHRAQKVKLQ
jgi:hypothetical protein